MQHPQLKENMEGGEEMQAVQVHNGIFHERGYQYLAVSRILDILILQDKTLFCAFEAGDIVC